MASMMAVRLRREVEAFLGRGLTIKQVYRCEEIIINFRPWVPFRYLQGLKKELEDPAINRNFGLFYYSLYALARSFRGYFRRNDIILIRGHMSYVYEKCDLMGGSGFSEKDLSTVIFLANHCSHSEIKSAIAATKMYDLREIRHLRGIVLHNRAAAIKSLLESHSLKCDEKLTAKINYWAGTNYPHIGALYDKNVRRIKAGSRMIFDFTWDDLNHSEDYDEKIKPSEADASPYPA